MGKLSEQPVEAIWNGRDYQAMRADHLAGRVPGSCAQCVRNGRVKRSAFLAPRPPGDAVPFHPAGRARLLAPADGELIGGPLVVIGELPPPMVPRLPAWRAGLPELRMDGATLVELRHYAMIEGNRFAAAIAIPWVTEGAHRLSLALPSLPDAAAVAAASAAGAAGVAGAASREAGGEDGSWDQRRLQIGRLGGEAADPAVYANYEIPPAPAILTAVARLAVALSLRRREPVPDLRLGGTRYPVTTWLCGPHANRWLGVALIDVETLAPGSYALELRLRHHPPFRRRLERLSPLRGQ
jgi:hypothetical protein